MAAGECPLTSESVSDIVGSDLVAGDPREIIGGGVSCAYLHETEIFPDASVSVGTWDGSASFQEDVLDTNTEYLGEPTDTPADLGDQAYLWNPSDDQTTLLVFEGDRYYTTTVNGIDDTAQKRDIVESLFETVS